jgi:hypothetical protein
MSAFSSNLKLSISRQWLITYCVFINVEAVGIACLCFFNLVGIYILIREEGSVFSLLPLVSPSRMGSLVVHCLSDHLVWPSLLGQCSVLDSDALRQLSVAWTVPSYGWVLWRILTRLTRIPTLSFPLTHIRDWKTRYWFWFPCLVAYFQLCVPWAAAHRVIVCILLSSDF